MASGKKKLISDCYIFPLISFCLYGFPPLPSSSSFEYRVITGPDFSFSFTFVSLFLPPLHSLNSLNKYEKYRMISEEENSVFVTFINTALPPHPFPFPHSFFFFSVSTKHSFTLQDGSSGPESSNKTHPLRTPLLQP